MNSWKSDDDTFWIFEKGHPIELAERTEDGYMFHEIDFISMEEANALAEWIKRAK